MSKPTKSIFFYAFPWLFGAICFYLGFAAAPALQQAKDGAKISKYRSIVSALEANPELLQLAREKLTDHWTKLSDVETKRMLTEVSKHHDVDGDAFELDERGNPQPTCDISFRLVKGKLEILLEEPTHTQTHFIWTLDH